MKNFEVQRKGNTRNLLTVASDRISIKLKDDQTPEQEQRVQTFLTKVAQLLDGAAQSTLRGTLLDEPEHLQITMKNGGFSKTFREND